MNAKNSIILFSLWKLVNEFGGVIAENKKTLFIKPSHEPLKGTMSQVLYGLLEYARAFKDHL